MSSTSLTDAPALQPIASNERIQALDVVRGFALIGIFLMNIEFFNRPIAELGLGLPTSLHGADYAAGWFIYSFVQGKFWTMFSLLFGMGFAVMLTRAERAGRNFLVPYMRRVAALAVFGACHHVFLWAGDILVSYAVGATLLLLLLWGDWKFLLLALIATAAAAALGGAGVLPGLQTLAPVAFALLLVCLAGLYLRSEGRVRMGKAVVPALSVGLGVASLVALAVSAAAGHGPPVDARWPALIAAGFFGLLAVLSARYKDPAAKRPPRLGVTLYLLPFAVMLAFGLLQVFGPQKPTPTEAQVASAMAEAKAQRAASTAASSVAAAKPGAAKPAAAKPAAAKPATAKPEPTLVEQAALREANRRLNQADRDADIAKERRIETQGTYAELVAMRAADFAENLTGEFGFGVIIIGMFLLGSWFVRSGIMENTGAHLDLFRRMAIVGVPVGVGLGLLGGMIATHPTPGMARDPYQVAMSLAMIGNLPACLGYVSLIVLMLHSGGALARIRVLAPLGRMALTNYLTHSLVSSLYFYHYGLGRFGMPRAQQVGFVFVVIALQVVFCHWWLSKFRYGPMEWVWRAITYWTIPPMRREPVLLASGAPA